MSDTSPTDGVIWIEKHQEEETYWTIEYIDRGKVMIHVSIGLNSSTDEDKIGLCISNLKTYLQSITSFGTDRPFLKKDASLPDTFDELHQAIISEIRQENVTNTVSNLLEIL